MINCKSHWLTIKISERTLVPAGFSGILMCDFERYKRPDIYQP